MMIWINIKVTDNNITQIFKVIAMQKCQLCIMRKLE